MRFSLFFLPALAVASPLVLETRATDNAKAIGKKLTAAQTDATNENATLNEFADNAAPSFFQAIALQQGGQNISYDIGNATKLCNNSAAFTSAESTTLYNQLNNKLLPVTTQLINNFIAHYPGLNANGYTPIVHDTLVQQRDATNILGTCLTNKSSGPDKSKGPALSKKFAAAFNKGITKYSS